MQPTNTAAAELLLPPGADPALDARYLEPVRTARAKYGNYSRPTYLILFLSTLSVLQERARVPSTALGQLFTALFNNLSDAFAVMGRGPAEHTRVVGSARPHGVPGPVYEYDRAHYQAQLVEHESTVVPRVRRLDSAILRDLPNGVYFYTLSPTGEFWVYDTPLTPEQLLRGVMMNGRPVKHPILAHASDGRVLAAGELYLYKDDAASVSAVLATRASGHYRPDESSIPVLREAVEHELKSAPGMTHVL